MVSTGWLSLPEIVLDCRGLKCPLPVLRTEKQAERMAAGDRLLVLATDPMARIDIPLFCTQNGYECETEAEGDMLRFRIARAQ